MDRRVLFVAMLLALASVTVLTQISIAPAPAQMAAPKITGKITDKVLKSFDGMGLPGVVQIQYRRFFAAPGSKIDGELNLTADHQELCTAKKGSITVTFLDGSKHTFKAGDIFNVPLNTKVKAVRFHPKQGYDETYWSINIKKRS